MSKSSKGESVEIDRRPQELVEKVEAIKDANDKKILEALETLERDVLAGKTKATLVNLRKIAGLSEGAINSREWAKLRIQALKKKSKLARTAVPQEPQPKTESELLKARVRDLLRENAILFEEILGLKSSVSRLERENQALQSRMKMKVDNFTGEK
tara:strand:+ start:173 stop:640 length:468 start_codon:yes stop_codon:yes gene_type:complete